MSTTSGPTLDAPGGGRPRKASVATRKLSARMDSEVADAFRLFDTVGKVIVFHIKFHEIYVWFMSFGCPVEIGVE